MDNLPPVGCVFNSAVGTRSKILNKCNLEPKRQDTLVRLHRAHCSHRNNDRGSVLGGGDGSWDEPISRAKGR
jgi:hypothetical protein